MFKQIEIINYYLISATSAIIGLFYVFDKNYIMAILLFLNAGVFMIVVKLIELTQRTGSKGEGK